MIHTHDFTICGLATLLVCIYYSNTNLILEGKMKKLMLLLALGLTLAQFQQWPSIAHMSFKVVEELYSIGSQNMDTIDLMLVKTLKQNVKEHSTDDREMVNNGECVSEQADHQDLHPDQVDSHVQQSFIEETVQPLEYSLVEVTIEESPVKKREDSVNLKLQE